MATSEKRIGELLASTGSRIDAEGSPSTTASPAIAGHVDGTLAMMAQWDVEMLAERLPFMDTPCLFLVGEDDGTVPPRVSRDAAARMPQAVSGDGKGEAIFFTRRPRTRWQERFRPSWQSLGNSQKRCPRGDMLKINDLRERRLASSCAKYAGGVAGGDAPRAPSA